MRNTVLIMILLLSYSHLVAHEGGHGVPLKQWKLIATNATIKADFIKVQNNKVWLMDNNHTIKAYQISGFSNEDQLYIKSRNELIH